MDSKSGQSTSGGGLDVETLSRQANEQRVAGQFEGAVALYEQALALDAGRADDWVNGRCLG